MKKHRINSKSIIALSVMLVAIFYSCSRVEIEQEVSPASVCDRTVYISTYVWTYNWHYSLNTLEYWEQQCVRESMVDSIKKVEYEKAIPTFLKVKKCN